MKGEEDAPSLQAVAAGFLPVTLSREEAASASGTDGEWPGHVLVRLGGTPPSISGRVVDAKGTPQPGVKVWVEDTTLFARIQGRAMAVEGLMGGGPTRDELRERLMKHPSREEAFHEYRRTSTRFWPFAMTDENGAFELEGLLERDYLVRALDMKTLLMIEQGSVAAGSHDVLLRLPAEALHPTVAGRVIDRNGDPIPDVDIHPAIDAHTQKTGRGSSVRHASVEGTTTDDQGRFTLENVPRDFAYLRMDGDEILPSEFGRGEAGLGSVWAGSMLEVEIVVNRRMHFKVELSDSGQADRIAVLDGKGRRLMIQLFTGDGRTSSDTVDLKAGASEVLAISDAAETLVLYSDNAEVKRIAMGLRAGEVNIIRP